jgi:superfamily II DNA/RNA helicase
VLSSPPLYPNTYSNARLHQVSRESSERLATIDKAIASTKKDLEAAVDVSRDRIAGSLVYMSSLSAIERLEKSCMQPLSERELVPVRINGDMTLNQKTLAMEQLRDGTAQTAFITTAGALGLNLAVDTGVVIGTTRNTSTLVQVMHRMARDRARSGTLVWTTNEALNQNALLDRIIESDTAARELEKLVSDHRVFPWLVDLT